MSKIAHNDIQVQRIIADAASVSIIPMTCPQNWNDVNPNTALN